MGNVAFIPTKGVVMNLLHRSRTDDGDVAVHDHDHDHDHDHEHAVDGDRPRHTADDAVATRRTRERTWTFAPGQLISFAVGLGFVVVGILALVRAELGGSLATPVVEVLGLSHTAWLGLAEIGLGVLLMVAGTGAWGRPLSVLLGALMVVAGILVLAEIDQLPEELGLERDFGWPLVALGALVAVATMALPVWRSHHIDVRDEPA
jgi:hypothetical protein